MKEDSAFWKVEVARGEEALEEIISSYYWDKIRDIWNSGGAAVDIVPQSNTQSIVSSPQSVFVNWIWAYGETFIPAVYWRNPRVSVVPKKTVFAASAKLAEAELNGYMSLVDIRRVVQRCLMDVICFGVGWNKVGWFTQFGQVPKANAVATESRISPEYESYLNINEPYVYRVSPYHVIVDPDADDISNALWVAQEHYRLIDAIRKDPFLKVEGDLTEYSYKTKNAERASPITGQRGTKRKWGRVLEIWDAVERKVYWLCDGSKKFNRVIDWPYEKMKGFPFSPLSVSSAVDHFYPPSPILPWLPLVEELSSIRTMRLDHIRRMVNKYAAPPGALTDEQKRAFMDPEVEFFEANNPDQIRELRGLQPEPQLYAAEDKIKADIREISGFSELLSGSVPYSDIAATTSAIMQKNAAMRFRYASEMVGEFLTVTAKKLFSVVTQYQDYPKRASISGEPNAPDVEYTREEIEGDYLFTIDIEEMGIVNQQQRMKNEYDTLVAMTPYEEVKKWPLLRDTLVAFGKKDYDEYLNPEMGPPLDPQFENELMSNGVPVQPNLREDFGIHLKVHSDFLQSPMYQQAISRVPQVAALFSEHMQLTLRMSQAAGEAGPAGPGKSSSLQEGSANMTSRPVTGARNTRGPTGNPIMQSIGNMMGG